MDLLEVSCRATSSGSGRGCWVVFPWLKLAFFLRFQKVGFFWVSAGSFVSALFAVLGVIADSEYVDCMGYKGTSILYADSMASYSMIRSTAT